MNVAIVTRLLSLSTYDIVYPNLLRISYLFAVISEHFPSIYSSGRTSIITYPLHSSVLSYPLRHIKPFQPRPSQPPHILGSNSEHIMMVTAPFIQMGRLFPDPSATSTFDHLNICRGI